MGWDVKDNEFRGTNTFRKKDEIKETGPATRGDKFLDKKAPDMTPKIGTKGHEPLTPAVSARITRNDREKTSWFFGEKAPEHKKPEKVDKTDQELEKLRVEF